MPRIGGDESTRKPYRERDRLLKELGHANYAAYLASPAWKGIRKAHLKSNDTCVVCEAPASEVHHSRYSREALTEGVGLLSVCNAHHRAAEFAGYGPNRVKRTPEQATAELARMAAEMRKFIDE